MGKSLSKCIDEDEEPERKQSTGEQLNHPVPQPVPQSAAVVRGSGFLAFNLGPLNPCHLYSIR